MKVLVFHSHSFSDFPSGEYAVAIRDIDNLTRKHVEHKFVQYKTQHISKIPYVKEFLILINYIWSFPASRFIHQTITEYKPDIVHFHGLYPLLSPSALKAAHDSGVPVVQTLHNGRWICLEGGFYRNNKYCNKCIKHNPLWGVFHGGNNGLIVILILYLSNLSGLANGRIFKWVDCFIAVSSFIKEQHVLAGFPSSSIVVKNNPINHLTPSSKSPQSIRKGIAFLGRLSISKGVNVLKHIALNIKVPFHVVGDGPHFNDLVEFIDKHGLTHVKVWGKRDTSFCNDILSKVVLTVIPSQCGDALPLVSTESLSMSTPIVASNVGGLPQLISDSGGGVLVNPEDNNAFIQEIQRILSQPTLARHLGESGKKYVDNNLNQNINSSQLLRIYEELIQKKGFTC